MAIKSIQRGIVFLNGPGASANTTISAVDMSKTELRITGIDMDNKVSGFIPCRIYLLNSTTIRVMTGYSITSTNWNISWELTEWQ